MYSGDDVAALYDVLNPWSASDEFYLGLVMRAASALDVGCGTGGLLRRAKADGHAGRLCGVDPDPAMLARALGADGIEWRLASAAEMSFDREFELATMTGHAFQFLVTDDEIENSLAAIRRALVEGGRFAFETRNPLARAWETWAAMDPIEVVAPNGAVVRVSYEIEAIVDDVVTFAEITCSAAGKALRRDTTSLRFLEPNALNTRLAEAGFAVDHAFGDWDRSVLHASSPEAIMIAHAV